MTRLQTTQSPLANPTRGDRVQPVLHANGFAQLHHLGRRTGRDQGLSLLIIQPRQQEKIASELFRAQGFPDDYEIEFGIPPDGSTITLTKTAAIRMCGNSVCPPLAAALARANCADLAVDVAETEAA